MVRLVPALTTDASFPIAVDFERAIQNVIQTVLPNAQIVGYWYELEEDAFETKKNLRILPLCQRLFLQVFY